MIISMIVAVADNGIIGKENALPWHLGADLKRFKNITTGHTILMGKNTHLSIGRPLPNRRNVILSTTLDHMEGCEVIKKIEDINTLGLAEDEELIIIGGSKVYNQFMPMAKRLYLTQVHTQAEGDTYFPAFDKEEWTETFKEDHQADEKNDHDFSFINLERK